MLCLLNTTYSYVGTPLHLFIFFDLEREVGDSYCQIQFYGI